MPANQLTIYKPPHIAVRAIASPVFVALFATFNLHLQALAKTANGLLHGGL
jgi:hypothetical protein